MGVFPNRVTPKSSIHSYSFIVIYCYICFLFLIIIDIVIHELLLLIPSFIVIYKPPHILQRPPGGELCLCHLILNRPALWDPLRAGDTVPAHDGKHRGAPLLTIDLCNEHLSTTSSHSPISLGHRQWEMMTFSDTNFWRVLLYFWTSWRETSSGMAGGLEPWTYGRWEPREMIPWRK